MTNYGSNNYLALLNLTTLSADEVTANYFQASSVVTGTLQVTTGASPGTVLYCNNTQGIASWTPISLTGPTGYTGPTGSTGVTGPTGLQGLGYYGCSSLTSNTIAIGS